MPDRLAGETSRYLQQHAGNPVDSYPWGDEALALPPAAKPFFAGTYFRKRARHDLPGFDDLLQRVADIWHARHDDDLLAQGDEVVRVLQTTLLRSEPDMARPR